MADFRMMHCFAGHARESMDNVAITRLDGVPLAVGASRDGQLWSWDLRSGERTERPLDLDDARPEEDWYREVGLLDEEDEGGDELFAREVRAEADLVVLRMTVTDLGGRPVVVTGGDRFDLHQFDDPDCPDESTMGGAVRVWDLRTGRKAAPTMAGHHLGVCSLTTVPSENGPLAVSGGEDCSLRAWDLTSGTRLAELKGHHDGMWVVAAWVDGRLLAVSGSHDSTVRVWDVLAGTQLGELPGHDTVVRGVAITELDGRPVAVTGTDDATVRAWDLVTHEQIGPPLTGHGDRIQALAATRVAGRTIAVTGGGTWNLMESRGDHTLRVWDLTRGERLAEPLAGHEGPVTSLAIGQVDGVPVVVSGSEDATVRVWDLSFAAG